jgi:hypothetical protein
LAAPGILGLSVILLRLQPGREKISLILNKKLKQVSIRHEQVFQTGVCIFILKNIATEIVVRPSSFCLLINLRLSLGFC